jgi:hypothetical protein
MQGCIAPPDRRRPGSLEESKMSFRKSIIAAALAAASIPAAFAAGEGVWVAGEIGYVPPAAQGPSVSPAVIAGELQSFRQNPVAADGSTWMGGEAGWVQHQHSFIVVHGVRMHANTQSVMGNAGAPLQGPAAYAPAAGTYVRAGG